MGLADVYQTRAGTVGAQDDRLRAAELEGIPKDGDDPMRVRRGVFGPAARGLDKIGVLPRPIHGKARVVHQGDGQREKEEQQIGCFGDLPENLGLKVGSALCTGAAVGVATEQ